MKAESQGKAAGLNDGIQAARGEVLFFTDVRQQIERARYVFWSRILAILTLGRRAGN